MAKSMVSICKIVACIVLIGAVWACQGNQDSEKNKETEHIREIVQKVAMANDKQDLDAFDAIYASKVFFYGANLTKEECMQKKSSFFKKNKDYREKISGQIDCLFHSETKVTCTFDKIVVNKKGSNTYSGCYLVLEKMNNQWLIVTESDQLTDQNLAKKENKNIPSNALKGDFNGDGQLSFCWLSKPDSEWPEYKYPEISFSDKNIPSFLLDGQFTQLALFNYGDLNGNGKDDLFITYVGDGETSREKFKIYSLINNQWHEQVLDNAVKVADGACDFVIRKIKNKTGWVEICSEEGILPPEEEIGEFARDPYVYHPITIAVQLKK